MTSISSFRFLVIRIVCNSSRKLYMICVFTDAYRLGHIRLNMDGHKAHITVTVIPTRRSEFIPCGIDEASCILRGREISVPVIKEIISTMSNHNDNCRVRHTLFEVSVGIMFFSRNCGCLVAWICYQLMAKPGNRTAAVP